MAGAALHHPRGTATSRAACTLTLSRSCATAIGDDATRRRQDLPTGRPQGWSCAPRSKLPIEPGSPGSPGAVGVGDVAGVLMTTFRSSPTRRVAFERTALLTPAPLSVAIARTVAMVSEDHA